MKFKFIQAFAKNPCFSHNKIEVPFPVASVPIQKDWKLHVTMQTVHGEFNVYARMQTFRVSVPVPKLFVM